MTDDTKENEFDPEMWYPLKWLAKRWKFSEKDTRCLEDNLKREGADVKDLGKGVKLVRFKGLGEY